MDEGTKQGRDTANESQLELCSTLPLPRSKLTSSVHVSSQEGRIHESSDDGRIASSSSSSESPRPKLVGVELPNRRVGGNDDGVRLSFSGDDERKGNVFGGETSEIRESKVGSLLRSVLVGEEVWRRSEERSESKRATTTRR